MTTSKDDIINLGNFEVQDKIGSNREWKFYKILNINNRQNKLARISSKKIENISRESLNNFSREIRIISKIDHPSIVKYLGYNVENFKNKPKPVIITEYYSNYTLYKLISQEEEKDSSFLSKWNDTKKLISIYGIASAIKYLHSHNILHRGINIENIFLDDNLYPKLFGFNTSIELPQDLDKSKQINESKIKGTWRYISPEILSDLKYSKSSDVYAFAIIMYEILNNTIPFGEYKHLKDFIKKILKEGQRPLINETIPKCYQDLIKRCWSEAPEERPTFEDIINDLRNNSDFITNEVNEDEFRNYIKYIDESSDKFLESKSHSKLDEIIQTKSHTFHKEKVRINLRGPSYSGSDIDLTKYLLKDLKIEKNGYNIYNIKLKEEKPVTMEQKIQFLLVESEEEQEKILNSILGKRFLADVYSKEINDFNQHEIVNFSRKLSILSQINHPAILNTIGYSPIDFNNKNKPIIVNEFCSLTLEDSYETLIYNKKLIFIYGIASAMAYLHSHDIIHRDLKPSNIYIDEDELPKLTGFDISKEISKDSIEKSHKIKGTPAYLAPEIYTSQEYSKASDVYAFGLVMYRIMTNKKPFKKLVNPNEIKRVICDEKARPLFKVPICKAYRNLIERCWAQNPKERPTFDEILNELKTNPDFITEEVDKEDFYEYIDFLDEFPTTFDPSKRFNNFDDAISSNLHTFKDVKPYPGLKDMFDTETNDLSFNYNFFDFANFKKNKISSGYFYTIEKLYNQATKEEYAEKYPSAELQYFTKSEIKNFIREMKIISQLNHPSILKYVGYNPDVGIDNVPSIIVEFSPHGTIYDFNKKSQAKDKSTDETIEWNDTKKLIYLYGIAAGMSYLHLHNIIHRDLKPGNIFLDHLLYPKISGFNISKEIYNNSFVKSYKHKNDNNIKLTLPSSAKPTKKPTISLKIVEEEEKQPNVKNSFFINLDKYERKEIISKSDQSKLYKFIEIETERVYAGQMSMLKINQISKSELDQLSIELDKISQLKHPNLLKFIGYSLIDFKKQRKPVIVTEYFSNGSLSSILEIERIKKPIQGWNDTKKLINIYGIASAMSYLHSQGIIHRSLKSSTIFLDEVLTPKIGDFGLSTRFDSSESITVQSITGTKASPIYSAPEVLLDNEYSKSSDVYSFAFIVYEIMTNNVPFDEISNNNNQVFNEIVVNQSRPKFNKNVPESYRRLIEKCWSHDPSERPSFDDIVYYLKMDTGFITDTVDSGDYQKYVDFIESQRQLQKLQKIDEDDCLLSTQINES